jgi:hypothetical protein
MQYVELNRVGPTAQLALLYLASRETMWLKRDACGHLKEYPLLIQIKLPVEDLTLRRLTTYIYIYIYIYKSSRPANLQTLQFI